MDDWLPIGVVKAVYPARREVRIATAGGRAKRLDGLDRIHLNLRDGASVWLKIEAARSDGDSILIQFSPGAPRDLVGRLKGAEAGTDRHAAPESSDVYDVTDLAGAHVQNSAGERVGIVRGAYTAPANDVLEIELCDGRMAAVPAVPEIIAAVDLDARVIVIDGVEAFRLGHAD